MHVSVPTIVFYTHSWPPTTGVGGVGGTEEFCPLPPIPLGTLELGLVAAICPQAHLNPQETSPGSYFFFPVAPVPLGTWDFPRPGVLKNFPV